MMPLSAVCVFCEDIREEKSGQDTIVGTLPDNLVAAKSPSVEESANMRPLLPRLGFYLRIHLDAERDIPKEISAKVINTDGQLITQSSWERSVLDHTFAESRKNKMPLVGLIFKVVAAPLPVTMEGGKITVVVTVDGVEHLAGALNVIVSTALGSTGNILGTQ
jgi:hypothetical protein